MKILLNNCHLLFMRLIYIKIATATFGIAFIFLATSWYVHEAESDMTTQVKLLIADQTDTLSSIAEIMDRDGIDAVVSQVIKDCAQSDRERFDTLLGNLATLSSSQLVEVERLFASCGNFYAERKAVMLMRLAREYEVYVSYVDLLSRFDSRTKTVTYPVDSWKALVDLEASRSQLALKLVEIQHDIITELRNGATISSEAIKTQITRANEVKETLTYTGEQIDRLRESIINL